MSASVALRNCASAAESIFQFEVLRLEIGEWSAKFRKLCLRSVQFESNDLADLQQLSQQLADILDVCDSGVRGSIAFAAMRLIAVKAEAVIKTARLGFRLFDELLTQRFEFLNLAAVDFEIRNDGAAFVFGRH